LAVPFFLLAGEIMNVGGLSRRFVALALSLVGHIKGGLGYVTIVAACLLAALSGSAVADAAALTTLLLPMMVAAGHDKARSAGLIASAGIIAPIIPPSIGFVVFGVAANVSISRLFVAAAKTSSVVMFLVAAAAVSAWLITVANIPGQVIALLQPLLGSPTLLMLAIMVLVMLVGTSMDMTPTILILSPVLMPLIKAA